MRILIIWTGWDHPRRCWEWLLAQYLRKRGNQVTLVSARELPSELLKPDVVLTTANELASVAEGIANRFGVPLAVLGQGYDPPASEPGWGEIRESLKRAVILSVSDLAKKQFLEGHDGEYDITTCHQGLDDETASKYLGEEKANDFIWIGPLEGRKHPEMVIEAAERTGSNLVMIGEDKLGLCGKAGGNIKCLGMVSDDEKFKELSRSRCLVNASRGEMFCIPAAEAGFFGIPLILPREGREGESVEVFHELYGDEPYYFDDLDGLVRCMEHVKSHPDDAKERGERLRKIVLEKELTMTGHAKRVEKVLEEHLGIKLNIGSFTVYQPKPWINLDILDLSEHAKQKGYNFQQVDVRKGIPYPDDSVSYVNTSHLIEHLTVDEAKAFLKECLRVLKPGATIRVGTPDLNKLMDAYKAGGMGRFDDIQPEEYQRSPSQADKFWRILTAGHKTCYDLPALRHSLEVVGFEDVREAEYDKSLDMYPQVSTYVQAEKPKGARKPESEKHIECSAVWANAKDLLRGDYSIITHDLLRIEEEYDPVRYRPASFANSWSRRFEYPWAILNADLKEGDIVLDAGGGESPFQFLLAPKCREVHNLDIDERWLDAMKKVANAHGHANIVYTKADLTQRLPYPNGHFDVVFCVSTLEHLPPPHTRHVDELLRILKLGGRLLLTVDITPMRVGDLQRFTEDDAKALCSHLGAPWVPSPADALGSTQTPGGIRVSPMRADGQGRVWAMPLRVLCFKVVKTGLAPLVEEKQLYQRYLNGEIKEGMQ